MRLSFCIRAEEEEEEEKSGKMRVGGEELSP